MHFISVALNFYGEVEPLLGLKNYHQNVQDLAHTKLCTSDSYDYSINNISRGTIQLLVVPAISKVAFLRISLFYVLV